MGVYGSFLYGEQAYGQKYSLEDYINIINSSNRKPRIKVELLHKNMEVYGNITSDVSDQGYSFHNKLVNGLRRSISLTLIDPICHYNISENSLWLDTIIRVYKGFEIGDADFIGYLQGTFILADSSVLSNFTGRSLELVGYDFMALLDGTLSGNIETSYQILNTTFLKDAVLGIMSEAGLGTQLLFDVIYEDYDIPYTITRSDTYFNILNELAELRSSNVYFDIFGNLVFSAGIEDILDDEKSPVHSFYKNNSDKNYINCNVKYDLSNVKNYIVVIGATVEGYISTYVAQNTDLTSPTCIDRIGKRVLVITDNNINGIQYAHDRAVYELKKYMYLYATVTITCLSLVHLDVNQVITLTDSDLGFNQTRLLIQSIDDSDIVNGQMTITCSFANNIDIYGSLVL